MSSACGRGRSRRANNGESASDRYTSGQGVPKSLLPFGFAQHPGDELTVAAVPVCLRSRAKASARRFCEIADAAAFTGYPSWDWRRRLKRTRPYLNGAADSVKRLAMSRH
jgi:hypothetical protein